MSTASALPFAGEHALVTGASRGIGLGVAQRLAALGATVHTADRTSGTDLTSPEAARAAVEALPRIDILVCNAGRIVRGPLLEMRLEDWDATLALNLTTPFVMGQAAARRMIAQAQAGDGAPSGLGGRIVHTASMRSFMPATDAAAYASSKAGLAMLMRAQASEWAAHGIRVNAVAPGWVATELTAAWRESPEREQVILGRVPMGGWGTPEDIADAVAWLVGGESRYVTGHVLAVDGGYLTR